MLKFIWKVIRIWWECHKPDWDGYEAEPIPFRRAVEALWIGFILLFGGYSIPDVTPSNDGTFSFEWYANQGDEIDFYFDPKKKAWRIFWVRGDDCYGGPLRFPMGNGIGRDKRGWPVPTDTHLIVLPPRKV